MAMSFSEVASTTSAVGVGGGVVGAVMPALRAGRLDVLHALHHE